MLALAGLARGQAPAWVHCPLNDHWYTLTAAMPWAQAEQQAVAWGGHLATIRSAAENVWISSEPALFQLRYWIGLYTTSDCTGPGNTPYQWISGEPATYFFWIPGHPDCNFNTDCAGAWDWERCGEMNWSWGYPGVLGWDNGPCGCPFYGLVEVASSDCDTDGIPDRYELATGLDPDCNANGAPDSCDVLSGQMDCDANGQVDSCELAAGTAVDADANGVIDVCEPFSFCLGDGLDPSHTTICPCGNTGAPGHGCANSTNPAGALLTTSGATSSDSVVLHGSGMPASSLCLYLQGDAIQDALFGDGVICTGGALIRLRLKVNIVGSSQYPDPGEPSLSTRGLVTPGSGARRYYQTYYRNPAAAFCQPATFNITGGRVIDW